jgi:cell division protein FtsZ
MRQAERSVNDLASSVDILTAIPNDRLLSMAPKGMSMAQAFRMADDVLRQAVMGISEIILTPGTINLDFSDIKAAISGMGRALIGNAVARGPNAAVEAARAAINSPLLEDTKIAGARQVLLNITGSSDIGLHEVNEACSIIREASGSDDLQVNFGLIANDSMGDSVKVTVIATGFPSPESKREPVIEVRLPSEFFSDRAPDSRAAPPVSEHVPPPPVEEPLSMAAAPVFEEELDVPAYLRKGKMVN